MSTWYQSQTCFSQEIADAIELRLCRRAQVGIFLSSSIDWFETLSLIDYWLCQLIVVRCHQTFFVDIVDSLRDPLDSQKIERRSIVSFAWPPSISCGLQIDRHPRVFSRRLRIANRASSNLWSRASSDHWLHVLRIEDRASLKLCGLRFFPHFRSTCDPLVVQPSFC